MKHLGWLSSGIAFLTVAFLLFSVPDSFEGPLLKEISEGHAIHLVDAIAIMPLVAGSTCIFIGLHIRRERLWVLVRRSPAVGISTTFACGAGLGLLLASAFSDFWYWWAVGAVLFGATLILASIATSEHADETHADGAHAPAPPGPTQSAAMERKNS